MEERFMVKTLIAIAGCVATLDGCCLQTVAVMDGGTSSVGTTTGSSSSTSMASSSSGVATSGGSTSSGGTGSMVGASSGSSGSEGGSSNGSTATGSSGSTGTAGCVANVLDGTPCPAGQTCNQTGTACVGDFAGPCASDADCPCGCSCAGAPDHSCTNCLTELVPFFPGNPNESSCSGAGDCGPACLGFTCTGGGYCEGLGLLLSSPSDAQVCAASPCTDGGVACASIPCTPDGGECGAACGPDWECYYGEDLEGPVLPGHCGEPLPGDGGAPTSDGGFLGTFAGDEVWGYETAGAWAGAGGGIGPAAYSQVLLPGPDAGTFIVEDLIAGGGCSPVFQVVRPDFAIAPAGTVCPLFNSWFASYVLTFGYAALDQDQLVIETLWTPAADGGAEDAVWYLDSMIRH